MFFFMNIGKTHLNSSKKIGQNILLFPCPSRKNAPFFMSLQASTSRFIYMKLLFQNQEKNAPFAIFGDELGCVFFFMNIGKTHLNSSLKIGQNILLFPCPSRKNAPFFFPFWGSTLRFTYMKLLFQNHEKNAPFAILSGELGCVFFS